MVSILNSFIYKSIAYSLKYVESIFKHKTNYIHYAIKSFLYNKKGLILEIGCHNGDDTILLSSISRNIKVHAFEPDPRLKIFLENKFSKFKNIFFYPYAVTFLKDDQNFYASKIIGKNFKNTGSSSLLKSSKPLFFEDVFKVPTLALDDLRIFDKKNILLIWVDVQGAEFQVIKSGRSLFNSSDLLWIEYGESEYEQYLSREELINLFSETHYVSLFSNTFKKGNLLLVKK